MKKVNEVLIVLAQTVNKHSATLRQTRVPLETPFFHGEPHSSDAEVHRAGGYERTLADTKPWCWNRQVFNESLGR